MNKQAVLRALGAAIILIGFVILQLWWWDVGMPWSGSPKGSVAGNVNPTAQPGFQFIKRRRADQPQPMNLPLAALRFPRDISTERTRLNIPLASLRFPRDIATERTRLSLAHATLPDFVSLNVPWQQQEQAELAALASKALSPQFVMALAQDQQGNIWVGCEDKGVFSYNPQTKRWQQFTTKDGLGDDNSYAVAVDRKNRVWVGHLNHGVSVYNGQKWQTYEVVGGLSRPDTLSGPLGERIFAITICPTDGDVWIASSAGLARYSESQDTWAYYTRADGLPSDQAQALAFDPQGNIYVGTQCDGIAMADAADGYKTWRIARGLDRAPTDPTGDGLPTSLINDVLVAKDGTVYAATTTGLAYSKDHGLSWRYDRGLDWAAKVKGLYGGPPKGWIERRGAFLAEDYVTCLTEDETGLRLGHRQHGCDLIEPQAGKLLNVESVDEFVTCMLRTTVGLVVGTYGDGLILPKRIIAASPAIEPTVNPLPSAAKPPAAQELAQIVSFVKTVPAATGIDASWVAVIDDDWRTRGDWLGRYGRYSAILAATDESDYLWGAGTSSTSYVACIGPHHARGDCMRYWIHWLYTDTPRTLELPPVYLDSRLIKGLTTRAFNRRQSEWDDHGEDYPMSFEGPDLYCTLRIPSGNFRLSLYDVNKDGHADRNRLRDYSISIRSHRPGLPLGDVGGFEDQPELARARILNFWGGVYKRFLVKGPVELTIRVSRNGSHNTILAAVMLDTLSQTPVPYFKARTIAATDSDSTTALVQAPNDLAGLAAMLGSKGEQFLDRPIESTLERRRVACMVLRCLLDRYGHDRSIATPAITTCLFELHYFPQWERLQQQAGMRSAREIEQSLRWNRRIPSYSGKGYLAVEGFVNKQND